MRNMVEPDRQPWGDDVMWRRKGVICMSDNKAEYRHTLTIANA